MVIFLARAYLGSPIRLLAVAGAIAGILGVALLILTPQAALDPIGVAAPGGAVSMALGTVLSRRWQPPVSALSFTAWQLTAGGLLLVPAALWFEPALPVPTVRHIAGFTYLGLIGVALTYLLWFRGLARLEPSAVAPLALLSPVTAVLLGWAVLGQTLSPAQLAGMAIVLGGVWVSQLAYRPGAAAVPAAR
jgi:probable blue pigment (indigoidine) exporter